MIRSLVQVNVTPHWEALGSVIIPADDQAAGIRRCLRRLTAAGPSAAVDAATGTAFALGARLALAAPAPGARWEHDDSSRT